MRQDWSLIFVHVPKAAGTSLETVVRRPYNPDEICAIHGNIAEGLERFRERDLSARARVHCLYGHIPFGRHSMVGPVVHMIMLRQPTERLISHYYYARSQPLMYLHDVARRSDLLGYVASGASELDNGQTRLISGLRDVDAVHGHAPLTNDVLEVARKNLQDAVVGLTESFDESLLHFRRAFGWRNICYVARNVTPRRPPSDCLPIEVLASVSRAEGFDGQLYADAVTQFRKQRETLGITESQVRRFRLLNSLYKSVRGLPGQRFTASRDAVFEQLQQAFLGIPGVGPVRGPE